MSAAADPGRGGTGNRAGNGIDGGAGAVRRRQLMLFSLAAAALLAALAWWLTAESARPPPPAGGMEQRNPITNEELVHKSVRNGLGLPGPLG